MLLDTNVVSEIRRANPEPLAVGRVRAIPPQDAYLSVVTVGELVYGARRLPAGARRRDLEAWITSLQQTYAARVLPVDAETATLWGELTASVEAAGRVLAPQDGLIAATALQAWPAPDDQEHQRLRSDRGATRQPVATVIPADSRP